MKRLLSITVLVLALGLLVASPAFARGKGNPHGAVEVYVTSQGLVYDSIVGPDLPPHGPFQLLEVDDGQLRTEFGPGDPGYVGGRWMMDTDDDGVIDKYFSCPLLGPGRAA